MKKPLCGPWWGKIDLLIYLIVVIFLMLPTKMLLSYDRIGVAA